MTAILLTFVCVEFLSCGGDDDASDGSDGGSQATNIIGSWYLHLFSSKGEVYDVLAFSQNGTCHFQQVSNKSGTYQKDYDETVQYSYQDGKMRITRSDGSIKTVEVISYTQQDLILRNWPDNGVNTFLPLTNEVQQQIEKLLENSSASSGFKSCPDINHPHMIDLGLPSGTIWACCNVGASKPEEYGDFYAWGETSTKNQYTTGTYEWCINGRSHVDIGEDISCVPQFDPATKHWSRPWRMPTLALMEELLNNTTSEWTSQEGVNGRTFTGRNGGKIFLPAGGNFINSNTGVGDYGNYWTSTIFGMTTSWYAYELYISLETVRVDHENYRCQGKMVRPIQ